MRLIVIKILHSISNLSESSRILELPLSQKKHRSRFQLPFPLHCCEVRPETGLAFATAALIADLYISESWRNLSSA